jgi:tetratricopeptide (TPR) repeat protein
LSDADAMTTTERRDYKLGRRSFESGDDATALDAFERLLRTRGGYADVHYMLGVLHERRDETEAAAQSFARALRINPSYAEARVALATLHERHGDFDRSRELTESAHGRMPPADGALDATTRGKLANLQAALGDAYREAGLRREAIEAYRKALDRCPQYHDIRLRLGVVLREAGLPDQALADFRRILRANSDYADASVQLGLTFYSLGRSEEALQEWRGVLERQPGHADAQMYLRLVKAS